MTQSYHVNDGASTVFPGFKPLTANFTQTPNQFFEKILGFQPYCVVAVVAILIRATLGREDPDTGERCIEADLPLSAFLRPELCESSARKGLRLAIEAGFIVKTQEATTRTPTRYALQLENFSADEDTTLRPCRAGHVYLLKAEQGYKIGKSRVPQRRLTQIALQLPFPVVLVHIITCDDCHQAEAMIHRRFAKKRLHGEWFALNDSDVQRIKMVTRIKQSPEAQQFEDWRQKKAERGD